jgi:hypothetical protein
MPRGISRMTKWFQESKIKRQEQQIKRILNYKSVTKIDAIFKTVDDGPSSDFDSHIVETMAILKQMPDGKILELAIEKNSGYRSTNSKKETF